MILFCYLFLSGIFLQILFFKRFCKKIKKKGFAYKLNNGRRMVWPSRVVSSLLLSRTLFPFKPRASFERQSNMQALGCTVWLAGSLVPQLGIKPTSSAAHVWGSNHWAAREFPVLHSYFYLASGSTRFTAGYSNPPSIYSDGWAKPLPWKEERAHGTGPRHQGWCDTQKKNSRPGCFRLFISTFSDSSASSKICFHFSA